MNRNRLICTAAALLAQLLLFGCTPPQTGNSVPATSTVVKPVVGVSLLTMTNPFFKIIGDSMQKEGAAHNLTVNVTAGEMDPAKQRDQVSDYLVKHVNAIVLSPVDSRSIGTSIRAANKAGIPVFTADIGNLDPGAKVVSHVATDNYSGGRMAGQAMGNALHGKGKVAIITHPEVESGIVRAKGFKEALAKYPGITIVADLPGSGQRDASFKVAQDILEKNPDINGIFAINDPSALGALAAIEKAGKTAQVKIIGYDGMPEAKVAIKQGNIYADIVQYPEQIGAQVIDEIAAYLAGEKVPARTLIPPGLYTREDALKDPTLK